MSERFPDIDWWCDSCGDYLNNQTNFDDHKYLWKCTKCGYKNSISKDNIYDSKVDYETRNSSLKDDDNDSSSGLLGFFKSIL